MQNILLVVHVLLAIFLVTLILLQQGKGASMASNLTGSTGSAQSVFGSQGAGSFMLKLTGFVALLFFVSTLTLNYLAHNAKSSGEGVVESAQKMSQQQKQAQQSQQSISAGQKSQQHSIQQKLRSSEQSSSKQQKQKGQSKTTSTRTEAQQNPAVAAAEKQLQSNGANKQQGTSSSRE